MDKTMLPSHERILLQVNYIIERRERLELEHQPADVSVEESFGNAVRVFLVINVLVVSTVFAGPKEHGVLEGPGTKNQCEKPHDPVRLKSQMRVEPVIAERNGKSASAEHHK